MRVKPVARFISSLLKTAHKKFLVGCLWQIKHYGVKVNFWVVESYSSLE